MKEWDIRLHTHTHTHIYIYIAYWRSVNCVHMRIGRMDKSGLFSSRAQYIYTYRSERKRSTNKNPHIDGRSARPTWPLVTRHLWRALFRYEQVVCLVIAISCSPEIKSPWKVLTTLHIYPDRDFILFFHKMNSHITWTGNITIIFPCWLSSNMIIIYIYIFFFFEWSNHSMQQILSSAILRQVFFLLAFIRSWSLYSSLWKNFPYVEWLYYVW